MYRLPVDVINEYSLFFFSSRRRHTRLQGDWSSDVCSSDLSTSGPARPPTGRPPGPRGGSARSAPPRGATGATPATTPRRSNAQIGRASCREREEIAEVGVAEKKKLGDYTSVLDDNSRLAWK